MPGDGNQSSAPRMRQSEWGRPGLCLADALKHQAHDVSATGRIR